MVFVFSTTILLHAILFMPADTADNLCTKDWSDFQKHVRSNNG